jgi:hypothetical protein
MSWMDLNDYLVIEEAAAARIDDLREEAVHADVETPARPRTAADRAPVCAFGWLPEAT